MNIEWNFWVNLDRRVKIMPNIKLDMFKFNWLKSLCFSLYLMFHNVGC